MQQRPGNQTMEIVTDSEYDPHSESVADRLNYESG